MTRAGLVFLVACSAAQAPAPSGQRFEIVVGKPVALDDGTTLTVSDVRYEKREDSRELSFCRLDVQYKSDHTTLEMAREHGGSDPESTLDALGWRFSLEVADPYRNPPRVVVRARKL